MGCLWPRLLSADTGVPVRIQYAGDDVCPDRQEFMRQLMLRTPGVRGAKAHEDALTLIIQVDEQGDTIHGRMTAKEGNGRDTVREVAGSSCEDVAEALALIAALFVEPRVQSDVKQSPRTDDDEYALPSGQESKQWLTGIGLGAGFENAWAKSPALGFSAAFELDAQHPRPIQPLIIFLLNYARSPLQGAREYEWVALRAAACPVRWPPYRVLYVTGCPFMDLGQLYEAQTDSRVPWLALGAHLRLEAKAFELWAFSLDAGFVVPLSEYLFESARDLDRDIPSVGVLGRLGTSVRF